MGNAVIGQDLIDRLDGRGYRRIAKPEDGAPDRKSQYEEHYPKNRRSIRSHFILPCRYGLDAVAYVILPFAAVIQPRPLTF
jgi:hypothetical protein